MRFDKNMLNFDVREWGDVGWDMRNEVMEHAKRKPDYWRRMSQIGKHGRLKDLFDSPHADWWGN